MANDLDMNDQSQYLVLVYHVELSEFSQTTLFGDAINQYILSGRFDWYMVKGKENLNPTIGNIRWMHKQNNWQMSIVSQSNKGLRVYCVHPELVDPKQFSESILSKVVGDMAFIEDVHPVITY